MNPDTWGCDPTRISALVGPTERLKDISPELIRFTKVVRQAHVCHRGLGATVHVLELRDDIFESECFSHGLSAACFELNVDNVDVEMVIGRLICRSLNTL